ncbi:hypothetical protein CKO11_03605 [Rhodobacter sp. TJ_12]|uniref:HypC/HybG/HupF family hydrogenase formation chaperone n=1 Tax=Rhodobacter sp. TJ_12 TaxID=2029399 RepID=UPI001CBB3F34|nr:HypC/HybG/HupF family hydrogenase formation chaperone [Rhodobacter sp. TJ_12]MBZ4021543.1 hypothetical protein [Rhodobacter sp. TJ_12]
MCIAVPAQLIALLPEAMGQVCVDGRREETISLAFVPEAKPGDHLLLATGFAIARIEAGEAEARATALREIGYLAPR